MFPIALVNLIGKMSGVVPETSAITRGTFRFDGRIPADQQLLAPRDRGPQPAIGTHQMAIRRIDVKNGERRADRKEWSPQ
ncbi:MAG: hypothetical protein J0G97_21650 [Rhizobium pusense]|nr:hypothetical protein [Agrobacterium pusense]